jgi:DNA polymerase-3 subunit delta
MKYQDLQSSLKQRKVLPLYLLYGEEDFLIQEALDLLIETVVDPGSRDFNFTTLYCRETPASELAAQAQTLPFMAEKRLVIAKEVDAYKAADLEVLTAYLRDPSPSTCLVLVSNQPKYDKKAVVSAVEAKGGAIRFYSLLDREITSWITAWCRKRGLALQGDAAQFLWQTLGNDLQTLNSELQKVEVAAAGKKKELTLADVRAVVGDFREYTPFDLATAVGQKSRERSLAILTRLLQEGEQPIALLGAIAWNLRRLLQAKDLEQAGAAPDEIMKKLRIIFHQAGQFREQMKRYGRDELRNAFALLLEADRALKSGGLGQKLVLERMILRLCS